MGCPTRCDRECQLDDLGCCFVRQCISIIESRGLDDQGLYRVNGVNSRVSRLMQMCLDRQNVDSMTGRVNLPDFSDPIEWETKTITSALKNYLRNLTEPLLTYRLHVAYVEAAKLTDKNLRFSRIDNLTSQLPPRNYGLLSMLIRHLRAVSQHSDKNLMTVSNLSICFGPTLLKSQQESVSAIMDIKFSNTVVSILIENCDKIFNGFSSPPLVPVLFNNLSYNNHNNNIGNNFQDTNNFVTINQLPPVMGMGVDSSTSSTTSSSTSSSHFAHLSAQNMHHLHNMRNQFQINSFSDNNKNAQLQNYSHEIIEMQILDRTQPHAQQNSNQNHTQNHDSQILGLPSMATLPPPPLQQAMLSSKQQRPHQQFISTTNSQGNSTTLNSSVADDPHYRNQQRLEIRNQNRNMLRNHSHSHSHNAQNNNQNHLTSHNRSHSNSNIVNDNNDNSKHLLFYQQNQDQTQQQPAHNQNPSSIQQYQPGQNQLLDSTCQFPAKTQVPIQYPSSTVLTLYACVADSPSELSFGPNEVITDVRPSVELGWLEGVLNGQRGLLPNNYVRFI